MSRFLPCGSGPQSAAPSEERPTGTSQELRNSPGRWGFSLLIRQGRLFSFSLVSKRGFMYKPLRALQTIGQRLAMVAVARSVAVVCPSAQRHEWAPCKCDSLGSNLGDLVEKWLRSGKWPKATHLNQWNPCISNQTH